VTKTELTVWWLQTGKKKKMPPVLFFLGIVFSKEERTNDADAIRQWIPSANV
jgi:hypothetical protein